MTPEIREILDKAQDCLSRARIILAAGVGEDAGRDAYLAALHAAQAIIRVRTGRISKTHRGVHRLISNFGRIKLPIRTSARVLGATLKAGQQAEYRLAAGRHAYLVPAAGTVEVNGVTAATGDGLASEDESVVQVTAGEDTAELVLVDTV